MSIFSHDYAVSPALVARKTVSHLAAVYIAFGNADHEIRLLNIYRHELAIANSEAAPLTLRQRSAETCADIVAWLGFTPEVNEAIGNERTE